MLNIEDKLLNKITDNSQSITVKEFPIEKAEYFYLDDLCKQNYVTSRLLSLKNYFLKACEQSEFKSVDYCSEGSFYTYGMISSPTGSKLNNEIYLFNTIDNSNLGMKLDLTLLKSYSLFNGQVLALKCTNSQGNILIVEKIYDFPVLNQTNERKRNLSFEISKGILNPEIINKIFDKPSNLYMFLGPFTGFSENSFQNLTSMMEYISKKLSAIKNSRAIIIPSIDDPLAIQVFPQPAIQSEFLDKSIFYYTNPCCLNINGHNITICNFDNLIDIATDKVYKLLEVNNVVENKNSIDHLISQCSFFPSLNTHSLVSYGSWLNMKNIPDLYITSSQLSFEVEKTQNTTMLNISKNCIYSVNGNKNGEYTFERRL